MSSDEYFLAPQSRLQRHVEARTRSLGDALAKRHGLTRRRFFQTASGMAAAFLVMNEVYGALFEVTRAEAADTDVANERAKGLASQFVMDTHTHFLRDDTRITTFVRQREAVGKAGWNPALAGKPQTIEDLKYDNYFKEIFLDSDTKVALLSSAPSEVAHDWFLTNDMIAAARARANARLGARRLLSHAIFTPGYPGWLEEVDRAIADLKPDSFKGYTIGDNTNKDKSVHPWRMDDEKLVYPFYEKAQKAGLVNICVHKGLFPPSLDEKFPNLRPYCDVRDVGKAAKDWPTLNFIIYHGRLSFPRRRHAGRCLRAVREDRPGRMGHRPRGDPGPVRRDQRLCRSRPAVRADDGGAAASDVPRRPVALLLHAEDAGPVEGRLDLRGDFAAAVADRAGGVGDEWNMDTRRAFRGRPERLGRRRARRGDVGPCRRKFGPVTRPATFAVERRRGWSETPDTPPRAANDMWDERRAVIMEKPPPNTDGRVRLRVRGYFAAFREGKSTEVAYELAGGEQLSALDEAQWADWDGGGRLLVATRAGRLQIRELSEPGQRVIAEADAGAETPRPAAPPAEALRW